MCLHNQDTFAQARVVSRDEDFMPTIVCTAKVSCKKLPGLLELTDTHLQWTQEGGRTPSIRLPRTELSCESPTDDALPGLTYLYPL